MSQKFENATNRREFIQGGAAMMGTLLTASAPAVAAGASRTKPPNLVFVYNEGQRADALSIAGHPILKTPNQDRIAREGVRFTNAFCTNALCAPARSTAVTGLWSRSSGALDNKYLQKPLPADIPIFTDLLHDAGYETAILGKVNARNGLKSATLTTISASTRRSLTTTTLSLPKDAKALWARKNLQQVLRRLCDRPRTRLAQGRAR